MSRIRIAILLCLALIASIPAVARQQPHIVADADTGVILSEKDADAFHSPASLTKMMLLYLAFRAIDNGALAFDQALTVSKAAAAQPAVKLGLKAGRTISVKDTIMAIVTRSSNDAAVVLAEALGGTESAFARIMTIEARELGMSRTTFRNATGLPNKGQVTSARDMLTLAQALMHDFPHHYPLFSTSKIRYGGRTYRSTNRLLGRYSGLDGLKTGYTRAAGFNLAASAVRDGTRLIVVAMGHNSTAARNQKVTALFDQAFRAVAHMGVSATAGPVPKPGRGPSSAEATLPASAPDQSTKPEAALSEPASWGIELGAHRSYREAHAAARAALVRLPAFAGPARLTILPATVHSGAAFRARLVGMNGEQAADACRAIRLSVACAPVSPDSIAIASAQ